MHYVEDACCVVPGSLMDGTAVVGVLGVPMPAMLGIDSTAGKHRRVIRRRACLLPDGTSVQRRCAFTHQAVERWGPRLAEVFDGTRVEAIDRDGDHMVDRIISRLIIGGVRQDRCLGCRWGNRR